MTALELAAALPDIDTLRERCRTLAVLDTIAFSAAGAFLRGFDHESPMSPYATDDGEPWPGLTRRRSTPRPSPRSGRPGPVGISVPGGHVPDRRQPFADDDAPERQSSPPGTPPKGRLSPQTAGAALRKGLFLRQLLRRLAVSALLAPVAAIGVTTMIASPAEAAPAKPGPSQPGSWKPGLPVPGSWISDFWKQIPADRAPSWRSPAQPAPTTPVPAKPSPTTPVPAKPGPTTPAPAKPSPIAPAPATPAPTTPAPATPAPGTSTEQALQTEINRLINVQRTSNGCAALTVNDQLTAAARAHSAWMAQTGTFSHTGSGGSTFVTRSKAAGYAQPSAENIAMGYRTAAEVVDGWMNSSGHRTNIVNCRSKTVGVGVVFAAGGSPYYTQNFGY